MALTCLDTLVGLSKVTYECFTDDQPAGYDTSDSGYHLTDADFGLEIIDRCEVEGWTMLTNALSNAVTQFKTDLRASLLNVYDRSLSPYSGAIGKRKSTGSNIVSKAFVGHSYKPHRLRGAKWVIKKFFVGLSANGTYTLRVTANEPDFTPVSIVVTYTNAGGFQEVSTEPIELPFYSIYEDEIEYFITLERGSAYPLNNTLYCVTCGNAPAYPRYMDVNGLAADDEEGTGYSYSSAANGLVVEGYLACADLDWICEVDELNGYVLSDVAARTIQFRGAALAIESLIHRNEVTLCTLYNLEQLVAKQNYLNTRYAENIAWIAQNVPPGVTDCFRCKPENTYRRAKLLV